MNVADVDLISDVTTVASGALENILISFFIWFLKNNNIIQTNKKISVYLPTKTIFNFCREENVPKGAIIVLNCVNQTAISNDRLTENCLKSSSAQ